jgi:hypothetical protein
MKFDRNGVEQGRVTGSYLGLLTCEGFLKQLDCVQRRKVLPNLKKKNSLEFRIGIPELELVEATQEDLNDSSLRGN